MKKSMLALAFASVFALFAQADATEQEWFDTKIPEYTVWPTNNQGLFKGEWNGVEMSDQVTLKCVQDEPSVLCLDTASNTNRLTFTVNNAVQDKKDLAEQAKNVTITSAVEFNPFDITKMPEVPEDAKAGLIVVTNTSENTLQYYVLAKDGEANAWKAANGAVASLEAEVSIAITNDLVETVNNLKAKYMVGDTVLTVGGEEYVEVAFANTTVSQVAYSGSGVLKTLTATYRGTDTDITITGVANTELTIVKTIDKLETEIYTNEQGQVTVPMGSKLVVTYTCLPGYVFADGLTVQSEEIGSVSGPVTVTPDITTATQAEAQIGVTLYTTLANAIAAYSDTRVVVYRDLTLSAAVDIIKAVEIDFNGKTVTSASTAAFAVAAGDGTAVVKFYNGKIVGTTGITIASGNLIIDGGSAYDYTVIEGTAGSALSFTGNKNIAFEYTGIPTFKSVDYASVVSTGITGFLGVGDNGSARFETGLDMSDDLVADGYEFYVDDKDGFTYIREKTVVLTHLVTFLYEKGGAEYMTTNVVDGTTAIRPADPVDPTSAGRTFDQWCYESDDEDIPFDFSEAISDDLTLYATWKGGTTGYELSLTLGEHVTAVIYTIGSSDTRTNTASESGIEVAAGATVTIDLVSYKLGYTRPDTGDQKGSSKTVSGANISFTFAAKELSGDLPSDVTPAEAGITDGAFKDAQPGEVNKVIKWANTNGATLETINAMDFSGELGVAEQAYLLNCSATELADELEEFKITSITFDANGKPVIPDGVEGKNYNGTIKKQGRTSLTTGAWEDVQPETDYNFFRYQLVK